MNDAPVLIERTGSGHLLLAFGGVAGGVNMAPFEFWRAARALPHDRIFVRDHRRGWYLSGIGRGLETREAIADHLRGLIQTIGPRTITAVGASAGGYAAILFARELGVGVVHAFGPQTTLAREQLREMRDGRWERALGRARTREAPGAAEALDLRGWVMRPGERTTEYHLHACAGHRGDRLHAERMEGSPGVQVHLHPCADHLPARYLRDSGELARLLAPMDRPTDAV